ncbi:MAG: PH domain-containing protein [Halobacteria archaeon]|nr:PH domain-containing protein [Halobacteria archaeon]
MEDQPDWVTLTEGESVVWQGRPIVYPYLGGVSTGLIIILLGVVVWLVVQGVILDFSIPSFIPSGIIVGVLVVLGILVALKPILDWWSIKYLITTDEVYKKQGMVSRTVKNLSLDKVQNTSFTQSVMGRLFSYGNVQIDTAGGGGTEMVFNSVKDPESVVGHITRQIDKR